MAYKITKECRIDNVSYKKGDIVDESVVKFFPSVMEKTDAEPKAKKENKKNVEPVVAQEVVEDTTEETAPVNAEPKAKKENKKK